MAGGLPPQVPPPTVPGLTAGPVGSPTSPMGGMMPPDNLSSALSSLRNRRGSATELMRQIVTMLETVARLDSSMKDRVGAMLALARGPARPGEKPPPD